ncbi:MAG: dihydroorotate dehydrogenase-like protein [Actinomycetota bacterium]|nr:dihydroorotate dehydrogenase-like protein [Actinomycetota bacterium]
MTDLTTGYLGFALRNPLVASASPLSHTVDGVRRLVDGGVAAVVLHSLFEEELEDEAARHASLAEAGADSFAESLSYFPPLPDLAHGRQHLDLVERAVRAVDVPVIASINGATAGGWTGFARRLQDAGAAAIELNIAPFATDPDVSGRDVEARHVDILGLVKQAVQVPVVVKLHPYFSSMADMARRLEDAGADGLVLFNRFLAPDIDARRLAVSMAVGLSEPADGRLARTWIALLRRQRRMALAASTGVEGPEDVATYLLAGADVVMTTSSLLRHGPSHAAALLDGLAAWMAACGFTDVGQLRGLLAAQPVAGDGTGPRSGYVAALRAANANMAGPW